MRSRSSAIFFSHSSFRICSQLLLFGFLFHINDSTRSFTLTCPCVYFNSSSLFHSPNFPAPFDATPCLLYHFIAPPKHRVLLSFDVFSLPPRTTQCDSFVQLFDDSEDGEVSLGDSPNGEWCGSEMEISTPLPSLHRHLLLYTSTVTSSRGFSGHYSFIPNGKYTSDALQLAECSFSVTGMRGIIYSPRYPYFAPQLDNCSWLFPQVKSHRLVLTSVFLELDEGSFLKGYEKTPQRGRFQIDFAFEASVVRDEEGNLSSGCSLEIRSTTSKSGSTSSSQLSAKSSSGQPLRCLISFQGEPNEKVSIRFTYFKLYVPPEKAMNSSWSRSCTESDDHVSVDVRLNSRLSRIDQWCGEEMPPQLMAPRNLLHLKYTTKSARMLRESAAVDLGFRLEYSFHSDWRMHNMKAKWDTSKPCRFLFNSSQHSSGELWSVNYPGLYPRGTVCEYVFYGDDEQIVHIHFDYFDMEGFNQCDESTQSDYVLFSNYQTHDRTNRRFCGKITPRNPIISESNYFRLIFSTNDVFDGTGFHARYQFLTPTKSSLSRVKLLQAARIESYFGVNTVILSSALYAAWMEF